MIALSDLLQPQSAATILATMVSVLESLGVPASQWRAKGVAASILSVTANVAAGFSQWFANAIAAGFLDYAPFNATNGGWLALLAQQVYGVTWEGPSFAEGDLFLDSTGAGVFNFQIGQLTVQNPTTKKTYFNTEIVALGAGDTGTFSFQANEQGSASTSGPGEISGVVTSAPGLTVTNVLAVVGSDGQTQDELVAACKASLAALSPNGADDAYNYLAISDPTTVPILVRLGLTTPTSVPITRSVTVADGLGGVNVYIATNAGAPISADVDIVNARIQAVCVPIGTRATVAAAAPVNVAVAYEVWLKNASLNIATAESDFASALSQYFASLPIGGFLIPPDSLGKVRTNALEGVLFQAVQGVVESVVSGSDTTLTADQVAVLGTITPTVNSL